MRNPFHALLQRLRAKAEQQSAERAHAKADRRPELERQVALGLEQLWKIEAQLLLPALHPRQPGPVAQAEQDIEVLRDLALLAQGCEAPQRELCWTVLQRLAAVHFARIDDLLRAAEGIDWAALSTEAEAWLTEWAKEIRAEGDIEDEDLDPVGLPPR
jgi:hypothetical protein